MNILINLFSKTKLFYKISTIITSFSLLYFILETLTEYWIKINNIFINFENLWPYIYILFGGIIILLLFYLPKLLEKLLIYFKTAIIPTLIINILTRIFISFFMCCFSYLINLILQIKPNYNGQLINFYVFSNNITLGKTFTRNEKIEWLNDLLSTQFIDFPQHLIKQLNVHNIPWDTITCKAELINYIIIKLMSIKENYNQQTNNFLTPLKDLFMDHPYISIGLLTTVVCSISILTYFYHDSIITMLKSTGKTLLELIRAQKEKAAQDYIIIEQQEILSNQINSIYNVIPKLINTDDQITKYQSVIIAIKGLQEGLINITKAVIKNSAQLKEHESDLNKILNHVTATLEKIENSDLL